MLRLASTRKTLFLILILVVMMSLVSGCKVWVKDLDGRIYQLDIPDQRARRVTFFLDQFSEDVKKLLVTLDKYRLKQLVIRVNASFHKLIRNLSLNSAADPADSMDLQDLSMKTVILTDNIHKELKREGKSSKRKEFLQALEYSKSLQSLIKNFSYFFYSLRYRSDP